MLGDAFLISAITAGLRARSAARKSRRSGRFSTASVSSSSRRTIDEYHIAEAGARCADAILLIAAILPAARLRQLREYAAKLGLTALVEVHNEADLQTALDSGAPLIGVNNRDLRTFEVSIETSLRLAPKIPSGIVKVSESGIRSAADIRRLSEAGFQAFLVGEYLMRSKDHQQALRTLLNHK